MNLYAWSPLSLADEQSAILPDDARAVRCPQSRRSGKLNAYRADHDSSAVASAVRSSRASRDHQQRGQCAECQAPNHLSPSHDAQLPSRAYRLPAPDGTGPLDVAGTYGREPYLLSPSLWYSDHWHGGADGLACRGLGAAVTSHLLSPTTLCLDGPCALALHTVCRPSLCRSLLVRVLRLT